MTNNSLRFTPVKEYTEAQREVARLRAVLDRVPVMARQAREEVARWWFLAAERALLEVRRAEETLARLRNAAG